MTNDAATELVRSITASIAASREWIITSPAREDPMLAARLSLRHDEWVAQLSRIADDPEVSKFIKERAAHAVYECADLALKYDQFIR
jgi:hypothetical protein